MISKSQKLRLGIFIAIALIFLLGILSLIVGNTLFTKQDIYYIAYKNVSVGGLNIGSAVQYHGIRIGRVEDLSIDPDDVTTVIVEISIKPGTPIKTDVQAVLSAVGITGLKQIELVGGDPKEENLKPKSYIKPGVSTLDKITGKAEVIAEKLERILNNILDITSEENKQNIEDLIINAKNSLNGINNILESNRGNIKYSLENISKISDEMSNLLTNITITTKEIDINKINTTIDDISKSVKEMNTAFKSINLTFVENRESIVRSVQLLERTIENINDFSRMISEDPSLLIKAPGFEEIQRGRQ